MRIVLLLIGLAVIGLTLARWLGQPPPAARIPPLRDSTTAPAVPAQPQDLKKFEQDLNRFMQDAASQRRREVDPP
ncbi:MAG: hypothetical protein P9G45_15230 [Candidatus Contendobacter sp.]|nr:hypothetical protein [Candidatus Contendobacter sp.]